MRCVRDCAHCFVGLGPEHRANQANFVWQFGTRSYGQPINLNVQALLA